MSDKPIPVILDTDVGTDIDDTWAIAMMLNSPELDVKLIVSATNPAPYRAKIICRLLEAAGRTDIPVGVGVTEASEPKAAAQARWVEGYELADYPGTVHDDGVAAMIDAIDSADEPPTLIAIGPLPNVAEALRRDPDIAGRVARFVGMHGSVDRGYNGRPKPSAEYNVVRDVPACRAAFAADWERTLTPLDTCGLVKLTGERFDRVADCGRPLAEAVIENYRIWLNDRDPERTSSVLFDTVAIHLAWSERFLKMEDVSLSVTDDGFTVRDPAGGACRVAIDWTDLEGFLDDLVERLTR